MDNQALSLLMAIDNKTLLLVLMVVLIGFVLLLAVLGVVFIVALRKRAPVVKVVMAPYTGSTAEEEEEEEEVEEEIVEQPVEAVEAAATDDAVTAVQPAPQPAPRIVHEEADDEPDEDDDETVTEGQERVHYDRSMSAKIAQLKSDSKEWYSDLKNDLLSYEKVKTRLSWKRETFRIGRMTVARLVVRGKTLCLMLAVEPAGYSGTKYTVEDVSNVAATADTPTMYRIKSIRRLKYAKEMIAGMMKELKTYKDPRYEAKDYFVPYEGDMALMQRGLVKRVVTGTTRTFIIQEVDANEVANDQAVAEAAATEATTDATVDAPVEAAEEQK